MTTLQPGQIVWVDSESHVGREQIGRRPHVVLCSSDYLDLVDSLFIAAPLTTSNRGWPNHVPVHGDSGLPSDSWIMTEQVRTMSRERIFGSLGVVSQACLRRARAWVADFLDLTEPVNS